MELFLSGAFEQGELLERRDGLDAEISAIKYQIDALETADKTVFDKIVAAVDVLRGLPLQFLAGETAREVRIGLLKEFADGLEINQAGKIGIWWKAPYSYLMTHEMKAAIAEDDLEPLTKSETETNSKRPRRSGKAAPARRSRNGAADLPGEKPASRTTKKAAQSERPHTSQNGEPTPSERDGSMLTRYVPGPDLSMELGQESHEERAHSPFEQMIIQFKLWVAAE